MAVIIGIWAKKGGGKLTLLLAGSAPALFLAPAALAQKSPDCQGVPCVKIGLMTNEGFHFGNFEDDARHYFIYARAGQPVEVDVLAKFYSGTDCDLCSHELPEEPEDPDGYVEPLVLGNRVWEWKVTGATSYEFTDHNAVSWKRQTTIALQEAGDVITISARVGPIAEGECDDDPWGTFGTHGGSHAGAEASCTIKLWRLDLEVSGEEPVPPFETVYETEFADSVSIQGTLVGTSPASPGAGQYPWEWESWIDLEEYATMVDSSSWGGTMVAPTLIKAKVLVVNQCKPSAMASAIETVEINPTIRRPNWNMDNVSASIGTDPDWLKFVVLAFPGMINPIPLGQNTNASQKYRNLNKEIVTPIYVDLSVTNPDEYDPENWPSGVPNDFGDFDSRITEIESGPNENLFYNSDTSLFEVSRIARLNYWTTPQGTWPSTDVPNPGSYENWLELHTGSQQSCQCGDPDAHGADDVGDIRHVSNMWHEIAGCPESSNQNLLGHQIRIKDAIEGPEPNKYDALWRADLIYAESESELRMKDENARRTTSDYLLSATNALHSYVTINPQKHNFYGFFWGYHPDYGWIQPVQLY